MLVSGLQVHLDGDFLQYRAPHLNFLTGKALERLKDGVSVAFIGQLSITSGPNSVVAEARSVARFALSYDIWEERFSVSQDSATGPETRRSISHLSRTGGRRTGAWIISSLDKALIPAGQALLRAAWTCGPKIRGTSSASWATRESTSPG